MEARDLPLFPLHVVLFPGMSLPLHIFEERYRLMIGTCMVTDRTFGVVLIQSGPEVGGRAEVFPVGTTARIEEIVRLPDGRMNLLAIGERRFRILERYPDQPYALAHVRFLEDRPEAVPAALIRRVQQRFLRYLRQHGVPAAGGRRIELPADPIALSYVVAASLRTPPRDRQRLLELDSPDARLRRELAILEWVVGPPQRDAAGAFSLN